MNVGAKVLGFRIDTRPKRRCLVAAVYASYILLWVFGASSRGSSGVELGINLLGLAVSGLILGGCWLALAGFTREYGLPGDSRMFTSRDERQTAVRHRAFVRAYWIVTAVICSGTVYTLVAPAIGLGLPGPEYRNPLLFGAILLSTTLPSTVIAWTENDDVPDTVVGPASSYPR
jgi:hypothetical protein